MGTLNHILKAKIKTKHVAPKALTVPFPVSRILRKHGILVMTVFPLPDGPLAAGCRFASKILWLEK